MKRRERLEKRAGELGLTDKRKRRDEPPLVIPHQDNEVENQRQDEAPPLVIPQQDPPLVIPQQDNEVQQLVQNDVGGDCLQKGTDDCSPECIHKNQERTTGSRYGSSRTVEIQNLSIKRNPGMTPFMLAASELRTYNFTSCM
ncbi:uncharacterized protein LOC128550125 [Mercenaria mercenaria]|uniref:uncharacterized protein LOC128550125 n=1 Tax=Mercenaria mercenaria TaxID=6596 RepID=UPI00234F04A6|nr:uncharacterized protein LOC128550125 [Mercenaria mercenaria]